MNEIDSISIIKRENLDENNYFKSLIEEALNNQMITDNEMLDLQMQLLQLLDERVYRYNGSDSSSIKKEIMEEISDSNIYTIGIYLKTFRNPDKALKTVKEKDLKIIYENGRKIIEKMLNIIRVMHIKVKNNKLDIQNYTYNETIIRGIKGFLKIYNPDFKAQDMKITADYPVYNQLIGKLSGVEFIKEYIYSIYLENTFCNKFSVQKIEYLLSTYYNDYKDLIINIFELVLTEVLACKLVKRCIYDLAISTSELDEIYLKFKNLQKEDIKNIIIKAYEDLEREVLFDNKELQEYIKRNLDEVVELIFNGVKNNTLDKVFITQKYING